MFKILYLVTKTVFENWKRQITILDKLKSLEIESEAP